jgi:hypothetical protein
MRGTDIIYYTYEADSHCIACTVDRFGPADSQFVAPPHGYGYIETLSDGSTIELDENMVRMNSRDDEGNSVHPAFASDEGPDYASTLCGTCQRVMCLSCGTTQGEDTVPGNGKNRIVEQCWNCHTSFKDEEEEEETFCPLCEDEKYNDDAFCNGGYCLAQDDKPDHPHTSGTYYETTCEACVNHAKANWSTHKE